jgi:hypothetical protein
VGLLLIRQHQPPDTTLLRESNRRVFDRRATHPLPRRLPPPPRGLAVASRREAEPVGIPAGLAEAHEVLAHWLDPVLAGGGAG